jgi:two-component system sensor histidine kinase PilS (NtrC family)
MDKDNLNRLDQTTFNTLVGIILRETGRMAKTITDFLQFARPATIQAEWFDFNRLVDEVLMQQLTATNTLAGASVAKEINARLDCWGDRQQIQTVLIHLLDNACQATASQQGGVVVAARECTSGGRGAVCVEVRDRGPGIPLELREKVFIPFFSNRTDGTGLGLAIVRQIVENHGGRVEIDTDADYACIMRVFLPIPTAIP